MGTNKFSQPKVAVKKKDILNHSGQNTKESVIEVVVKTESAQSVNDLKKDDTNEVGNETETKEFPKVVSNAKEPSFNQEGLDRRQRLSEHPAEQVVKGIMLRKSLLFKEFQGDDSILSRQIKRAKTAKAAVKFMRRRITKIQWTEDTWNPTTGCTEVSAGCRECYAAKLAFRLSGMRNTKKDYKGLTKKLPNGKIVWTGIVNSLVDRLQKPLKKKNPTIYFVNSMSDLFHKEVAFEFIDRVFAVMAVCSRHTFQILTKRPERMLEYLSDPETQKRVMDLIPEYGEVTSVEWPLRNAWLGTSCENQKAADERIPLLAQVPAAVRFLSCEPLIGKIDLYHHLADSQIHWVIIGGESGSNHRPMDINWAASIIAQCKGAGVAVFNKQLGSSLAKEMKLKDHKGGDISEWLEELQVREFPE